MNCPDCSGTGKYQGLFAIEDCSACGGSGQAAEKVPQLIATPAPGPHVRTSPNGLAYLFISQKWMATSHQLIPGLWYEMMDGLPMPSANSNYGFEIDVKITDYMQDEWVCEYIGNFKNKYHRPDDQSYQAAMVRAGADPAYTKCRQFEIEALNGRYNLIVDEFEHSRAAIEQMVAKYRNDVILAAVYNPNRCLYELKVR